MAKALLGFGTGGGGGLHFRVPPDSFSGATRAAAVTARNTYFSAAANAGALAQFQGDQSLAIILTWTGGNQVFQTYLPGNEGSAYSAAAWVDRTDAVQSVQPGPPGTPARYSNDDPLAIGDAAAPGTADEAARRDHVHPNTGLATTDALTLVRQTLERELAAHEASLHITAQQARDIARAFVGASVTGTGESRVLTLTRADGANPLELPIPNTGDGSGSGSGGEDVHVRAAGTGFDPDTQMLTLALSDGTTVQVDLAALVTQAELNTVLAGYALLSGAKFTGAVEGRTPVADTELTPKSFVDAEITRAIAALTPGDRTTTVELATLGQPDLAESDAALSGVLNAAGDTSSRLLYSVVSGDANSGEQLVRWNPAIVGHSLPAGAKYDSATGILTLPHGVWIIEAVLALEILRSATQPAVTGTLANVSALLYESGEMRYKESAFFWGSIGENPALSVTGSLVIPQGKTDTVQVRLLTTPGGSQNPTVATRVVNAHMEAIRVGDAVVAAPSDEFVFGLSADATPESEEGTIAASRGSAIIGPFTDRHILIFRLASQGDIASVIFSDDPTATNQIGGFSKSSMQVTPKGEVGTYNVWVSNQLLTRGRATMEVR